RRSWPVARASCSWRGCSSAMANRSAISSRSVWEPWPRSRPSLSSCFMPPTTSSSPERGRKAGATDKGPHAMQITASTGRVQTIAAILVVLGMAVALGTALAFQHLGGYIPCALCLEQRVPYYIGIPVTLLALASSLVGLPGPVTRLLLAAAALLMAWTLVLGIYHSGVEWAWWPGPTDCVAVAAPGGSG